jgi:hypothetical protein
MATRTSFVGIKIKVLKGNPGVLFEIIITIAVAQPQYPRKISAEAFCHGAPAIGFRT